MAKGAGLIYRSFVDAARLLDDASQLEAMNAYFDYLLDGIEYTGENAIVKVLLLMAIPAIDSAQARYEAKCENGKKGGRPKTKAKPNETENNLTETETKANETLYKEEEEDKEEDKDVYEEDKEEEEEDIKAAPACAVIVPSDIAHEIKKRVVLDGDLSDLAETTWIQPAKLVQDKNNVYICSKQKQAVQFIRDRYGGFFETAIRAVNPEFSGEVVFAIA